MQGRRSAMGKKDIAEKTLISLSDVFADICNVLIFKGRQVIKPEALLERSGFSQYKAANGRIHEQMRDVVKLWKNCNIGLALIGVENQTKSDKDMPFRIIGYDGAAYRGQLKKDNKRYPVVTLVLYFGDKEWNCSTSLKDCFEPPLPDNEVTEALKKYINDYNANVFDIGSLSDEEVQLFRSDFRVVANFFVKRRRNKNYVPDDTTEIKYVEEVLELLSAMTGDRRYEEAFESREGDVKNMCDVAQRLEDRGMAKGMAKGQFLAIISLIQDGIITPELGASRLGISLEELEKAMAEEKYSLLE